MHCISSGVDPDFLIVSPDGSGQEDGNNILAVEVKCPMPNKKYTTDVHYEIPRYYNKICQIMAEMKALGCKECIYILYTPTSTHC